MDETVGIVVDTLGSPCRLINTASQEAITLNARIDTSIEVYENKVFVGTSSAATLSKKDGIAKIGDTLEDLESGVTYQLDAIKDETPSKIVFYTHPV